MTHNIQGFYQWLISVSISNWLPFSASMISLYNPAPEVRFISIYDNVTDIIILFCFKGHLKIYKLY